MGAKKRYGPQVTLMSDPEDLAEIEQLAARGAAAPRDRAVIMRQAIAAGLPLVRDYYAQGGDSFDVHLGLGEAATDALRIVHGQGVSA